MTTTTTMPASDAPAPSADHAAHMDRIYRFTRHIYDATRKFFLFGRDTLLRELDPPTGSTVLEVGCGTARNLVILSKRRPDLHLLGVDASAAMLDTARKKLTPPLASRVTLAHGLAERLDLPTLFGSNHPALAKPLQRVFFSYALTMIPPWREALDRAITLLPPGGQVHAVDFWDQAPWPRPARAALVKWLDLFSVRFRPELIDDLRRRHADGSIDLCLHSIGRQYAFRAVLTKRG